MIVARAVQAGGLSFAPRNVLNSHFEFICGFGYLFIQIVATQLLKKYNKNEKQRTKIRISF